MRRRSKEGGEGRRVGKEGGKKRREGGKWKENIKGGNERKGGRGRREKGDK